MEIPDEVVDENKHHRHNDAYSEGRLPGTKFPSSVSGLDVLQRRNVGGKQETIHGASGQAT